MSGVLLAVALISGIHFILSFLVGLFSDEQPRFAVITGVIFTIVVWPYVLALGIIGLVLSVIALFINVLIQSDVL